MAATLTKFNTLNDKLSIDTEIASAMDAFINNGLIEQTSRHGIVLGSMPG